MPLCVLYECATETITMDGDPIAYCDKVDAKSLFYAGREVSQLFSTRSSSSMLINLVEYRFKADIPAVSTWRAQYTSAKLEGET